ncbi:MAG TPA: HAD hydrolase family protein, partial [Gemmataceae bacterium]|nr:HAD hydrolase family protein [Gemmataceae bacterium]
MPPGPAGGGASAGLLDAELRFYEGYGWCLNPIFTVGETVGHLRGELARLGKVPGDWQAGEVMRNVFLLACGLLNSVDDYLLSEPFHLPGKLAAVPFSRTGLRAAEKVKGFLRRRRVRQLRHWRAEWEAAVNVFLRLLVAPGLPAPDALAGAGDGLASALSAALPADLLAQHTQLPSAFRKQDLTHDDVLALGRQLVAAYPGRQQPILVIGLRTAGSYFAPLLRAFLEAEGYADVAALTLRPNKGVTPWDRAELARRARAGHRAVVVDEPPGSGDTIALAVDVARRAGFADDNLAVLFPVHPMRQDWGSHVEAVSLANLRTLRLEPEDWHKRRLLDPKAVEGRLAEYYGARGWSSVRVVPGPTAARFNAALSESAEETRRTRLKCVYEVRLENPRGEAETRYVLAKGVGWGYLSYHAVIAGHRLAGHVPPVLGLRDGILYTEWIPQPDAVTQSSEEREQWVQAAASYVAARARALGLPNDPSAGLGLTPQHEAFELLEKVLSKAYGGAVVANLMRGRVRHRLANLPCPMPTLIDARMRRSEWVRGPSGLLKTDFEHHGLGKNELNVADPAFDLADAIFQLALSPEEEARLLRRYVEESHDDGVGERLFLNKLLAGLWALALARKYLFHLPLSAARQQDLNRQYVRAWDFLTVHALRQCAAFCAAPREVAWRSPLVVLDIDGVLDTRLLGFPCTTAAGIRALSLLHAHDFAVAVDTARSVTEVKEYCRAYHLAGGVAEYGSYVWDAVAGRGRPVVTAESLRQMEIARQELGRLPGVFLNDGYEYSLRAYTYAREATVPLPISMVRRLESDPRLDRLRFHQTTIDTAVVAAEVDKGTGLTALLEWAGVPGLETVAVGDSEPDLAMFRVARRRFAPGQIDCARLARFVGCRIARRPYQQGLLEIARSLAHPDGGRCERCAPYGASWPPGEGLFLDLLRAADGSPR